MSSVRFKTVEEWSLFCDTSRTCLCGQLMTGLHMRNCSKVRKQDERFGTMNGGMSVVGGGK